MQVEVKDQSDEGAPAFINSLDWISVLAAAFQSGNTPICRRRKKAKAAAAAERGSDTSLRVSSRSTSRDEEFFIGVDDSDTNAFSEESLRVRGNSDSNDNRTAIEDAELTMTSDEAGDLVQQSVDDALDSQDEIHAETA